MLEPWLHVGDRSLAFAAPHLVALAWAAPAFLLIALVVTLARRRARRRAAGAGAAAAEGAGTGASAGGAFGAGAFAASARDGRAGNGARAAGEAVWPLWLASGARTLAYLCAVGAAAGATLVQIEREDRLGVVALVDRSASIAPAESQWMTDWLGRMVDQMRRDDQLAVLGFARETRLVFGPGAPALPPEAASPELDRGATNLMTAIETGASLALGPGTPIVLLSDGQQTAGDATAAAESARRRGLRIFPIAPPRAQAPLTIEHVAVPQLVREGRDLRLAVAIANRGPSELEATLVARQGERELGRVPLRVAPGRSVVDAEVRAGTAGHFAVSVSLEGEPHVVSARARRTAAVSVLPRPRVLLLSHDAALEPLLREAGFDVARAPRLGDLSAEDLARYHAVVIGELERRDLPAAGQQALERYVRELGGGLIVAAGRGLVSDVALRGSPLERILPVRVKEQVPPKREREPLALFLVVDRSSSMSYGVDLSAQSPTRMAYAREAALALLAQLGDGDQVGAIAFDTQTSMLAALQPLSANRDRLVDLISRLQPSGGTDFKEALEIAARQLVASGKPTKHVILLTDGASIRPAVEHEPLIAALARAGITVTSIRIGSDKDSYALVQSIAEQTGGHFYLVTDAVSLPNLMIQDTQRRAGREEKSGPAAAGFRPRVRRAAEALGGLRDEDLPVLRDFAAVPLKPGAEEWLSTEHAGGRVPILAGWQNGLGRAVVLTADPSPEWQSWGQVRRFWAQLVRWVARPESNDELRLAVRSEAGRRILSIDSYAAGAAGELAVRLTDRDGRVRDALPTAVGPRRWELALPPLEAIEPRVVVSLRRGGEPVFSREEWLPTAGEDPAAASEDPEAEPSWPLLAQLAEITGGETNAPLATILARAPAERQVTLPLREALAAAALALVLADVLLRLLVRRFG